MRDGTESFQLSRVEVCGPSEGSEIILWSYRRRATNWGGMEFGQSDDSGVPPAWLTLEGCLWDKKHAETHTSYVYLMEKHPECWDPRIFAHPGIPLSRNP